MSALEFLQNHPLNTREIWTREEAQKLCELLEAEYPDECNLLMDIPVCKATIAAIHHLAFNRATS